MNDWLTIAAGVLIAMGALACMAVALMGRVLENHLRRHHPAVWRKLGFPPDHSLWVKAKNERQAAGAQFAMWRYLRTGEFRKLQDPRFDKLVRRWAWLLRIALAILLLLLVGAIVRH